MQFSSLALVCLGLVATCRPSAASAGFLSHQALEKGKRKHAGYFVEGRERLMRQTLAAATATTLSARSDESSDSDAHITRRNMLLGSVALPLISDPAIPRADAATNRGDGGAVTVPTLLADVPMIRLRLPKSGVGREYVVVQLKVDGQGPFDFMVDSGLTTELITPHLQQTLGIRPGKTKITGLAAGGDTAGGELVMLTGASLCCGEFSEPGVEEFRLPPLRAVVADFPQEHLDPAHDPVEGMLGMELLTLFDIDFDFPAGRLRLWRPGTAAAEAGRMGMVEVPAAVLNETLLLGMRVVPAKGPSDAQPVVGILDCGAAFSAVNWSAAGFLGLPPKQDRNAYLGSPTIMGMGVDGRPQYLPMKDFAFTYRGDPSKGEDGKVSFEEPPASWRPWKPVQLGIGDLPVFSELLGDGRRPYSGPAALIGLDVLSQRRVIMEAGGTTSRRRRLFVSSS